MNLGARRCTSPSSRHCRRCCARRRGACAAWCGGCRRSRRRSSPRALLDRLLWPRLDATQRQMLAGRTVEVELLEPGVRLRLRLGGSGFEVAPPGAPALVIRAQTAALLRLARGQDDADRLFFERALVMEGDTEFGLMLKNTLDAIGPLWAGSAR